MNALILAGSRGPDDPMARAAGVSHKAMLPVDGVPMLLRVVEAVRDLDGGLLTFGFAKLLWRLKRKTLKTARVPLMGIRKKYHGTLTGAALLPLMFHRLKEPFLARGLEQVELSWILEDNMPMRRVLEGIGAKVYKTHRVYEKALA